MCKRVYLKAKEAEKEMQLVRNNEGFVDENEKIFLNDGLEMVYCSTISSPSDNFGFCVAFSVVFGILLLEAGELPIEDALEAFGSESASFNVIS